MKNFFAVVALGLFALVSTSWGAAGLPQPSVVKQLGNYPSNSSLRTAQLGTQLIDKKIQVMRASYTYSVQGGSDAANINLLDVDGKDAVLPNYSIIKQVICDIITQPVGVGASISLGANTAVDIKASTSVASWTVGEFATIPVGTAGTAVKLTAQRTLVTRILGANLSAGRYDCFVEYYIGQGT